MNRKVKRYDPINSDGTCGMCVEDADYGAYVEFADYAALEAERDQLRAEVERLKDALEIESHRLAACGVAALGYFDGCAEEYRSASLNDVLALRAQRAQQQVPGWKLVPVEPTLEMANASVYNGTDYTGSFDFDDFKKDWTDILAAAPAPVPSRELIVSKLQTECSAIVDDTNHLVAKLSAKYPPAVNLTMHDILRALEAVPGAPMMTSNMCHAIAQQLNAARPTDQLPVGYVHFKAPVQAEPASPWVAVSERLPEPETDVVVRFVFGGAVCHGVAGLFGDAGEFEWWEQSSQAELRGRVTHWMPLPPAPEVV